MTDQQRAKKMVLDFKKDKIAVRMMKSIYHYFGGTFYYYLPDCCDNYCNKYRIFPDCKINNDDDPDYGNGYWIDFNYDDKRAFSYVSDHVADTFNIDLWSSGSEDLELGRHIFDELVNQGIITLTEGESNVFATELLAQRLVSKCEVVF